MFKNSKKTRRQSYSEKSSLTRNYDDKPTSLSRNNIRFDENQITLLTKWLTQLNREKLITITDQNDIVIMVGEDDSTQQLFVNSDDIDTYMDTKVFINKTNDKRELISMYDLATILLKFGYVQEVSGQLSFNAHTIALGNDELRWLASIVREARPSSNSDETQVTLFDGENTEVLSIPYQHMLPTNDRNIVANYLFRNGHVRYDVNSGTYAYRYVPPDFLLDEKLKSPERIHQHQFLSFHIRTIHVDQKNKRIQLEFRDEPNHYLVLPKNWYRQISDHQFDRDYIIDILLANGGVINTNTFVFMGQTYSLQENKNNSTVMPTMNMITVALSLKEKNNMIRRYVDLIIEMDGVNLDQTNELLVLTNNINDNQLYFTPEHSLFIKQNKFHREDVIYILVNYSQIKQDQLNNYFLYYNNQYIQFPSSITYSQNQIIPRNIQQILPKNKKSESVERYHNIIDYMYRHGLVTWDKPSKLIKLHFSDQNLLVPIDHLRSIINPRIASSSSTTNAVLPFTSRQLSQWLINNSYITKNNY
jgi:hypothetical protein